MHKQESLSAKKGRILQRAMYHHDYVPWSRVTLAQEIRRSMPGLLSPAYRVNCSPKAGGRFIGKDLAASDSGNPVSRKRLFLARSKHQ